MSDCNKCLELSKDVKVLSDELDFLKSILVVTNSSGFDALRDCNALSPVMVSNITSELDQVLIKLCSILRYKINVNCDKVYLKEQLDKLKSLLDHYIFNNLK